MVAVGGDAVEVSQQELAQLVHLGEALPPQGAPPTLEEVGDPTTRLVRPQVIELFAQDVRVPSEYTIRAEVLEVQRAGTLPSEAARVWSRVG